MNFNFEQMLLESMEEDLQQYAPTWNIATATAILPRMKKEPLRKLIEWLHQMPKNRDMEGVGKVTVGASLTADLDQVRWRVSGNPEKCMTKMVQYLMKYKLNQNAIGTFARAVSKLNASETGMWIEQWGESFDLGGFLKVDASIQDAFAASLHKKPDLLATLEAAGVERVSRWGCSFNNDSFSSLIVNLPGDSAADQVGWGSDIIQMIGATPLPYEAIELLETAENASASLAIWWNGNGLLRTGVRLDNPSTDLQLKLYIAAKINNDQQIAAFESVLQMKNPSAIECFESGRGYGIDMHYDYVS